MYSKEALEELIENAHEICEWELFRLKIIKQDLEVLEILKDHLVTADKYIMICIHKDNKDFNKVKEWLEYE